MQVLAAWRVFLHGLAMHAPDLLGRVAPQANVALLPLLESVSPTVSSGAVAVLTLLVVDNIDHVRT